jgi:hypothetical protein
LAAFAIISLAMAASSSTLYPSAVTPNRLRAFCAWGEGVSFHLRLEFSTSSDGPASAMSWNRVAPAVVSRARPVVLPTGGVPWGEPSAKYCSAGGGRDKWLLHKMQALHTDQGTAHPISQCKDSAPWHSAKPSQHASGRHHPRPLRREVFRRLPANAPRRTQCLVFAQLCVASRCETATAVRPARLFRS